MKKLFTLLILLTSLISYGQRKTDSKPFVGATKIIVTNENKAEDNYKLSAKVLLDMDYAIEKSDKEFFQIYTEGVTVYGEGTTRVLTIYVLSRDNQITIVGKTKKKAALQLVNVPQDTENFEIMPFKNNKLLKDIFQKLSDFAMKLKGSSVIFSE